MHVASLPAGSDSLPMTAASRAPVTLGRVLGLSRTQQSARSAKATASLASLLQPRSSWVRTRHAAGGEAALQKAQQRLIVAASPADNNLAGVIPLVHIPLVGVHNRPGRQVGNRGHQIGVGKGMGPPPLQNPGRVLLSKQLPSRGLGQRPGVIGLLLKLGEQLRVHRPPAPRRPPSSKV